MESDGDYGTLKLDELEWIELRDAIERARVVGVLDAWRAQSDYRAWGCSLPSVSIDSSGQILGFACHLETIGAPGEPAHGRVYRGATPDAARAAAAKAIEAGEV
jgi:hypothetical protein